MTISWPLSRQQVLDASGRPYLPAYASFFEGGTTKPLTVYSDAARTVPLPQPVKTDGSGRFPRVYLPDGLYAEEVVGPYGDVLWRDDNLGAPVQATDPDTPDTIDPKAVAQTGDVKWRLDAAILPGWVRLNGRSIGDAGSGATELADVSTRALYLYLWQTFADTVASVVGGRGQTAAGDFTAGKPITTPTMRGMVAAGLDDMGSTPSGQLQVLTDITLTAGQANATVASPARLALGMTVLAAGVSAGTTIVDIVNSQVTLSQPASAGSTGTVPARFSLFGDAQAPAATGGGATRGISVRNLPPDMPDGSVTVPYPPHRYTGNTGIAQASLTTASGSVTVQNLLQGLTDKDTAPPAAATLGVSIGNEGGGAALATLQPTRLGTYYVKL